MNTVKRLDELAVEKGVTPTAIAKMSGINPSTINTARKRGGQLSVETIEAIYSGLGISLAEFFAGRK